MKSPFFHQSVEAEPTTNMMENACDFVEITDKDFDIPFFMEKLTHNDCGATAVFIGLLPLLGAFIV